MNKNHSTRQLPRIVYVAYPSSLELRSANAVQTFSTVREMKRISPSCDLIVPRFAWRPSAFSAINAIHLPRIPFNVLRHVFPTVAWSYLERSWFALSVIALLTAWRLIGKKTDLIYVRDIVCAAWFGCLSKILVEAKVIYEAHDLESDNPSAKGGLIIRSIKSFIDKLAIGKADGIVSLTKEFVSQLHSRKYLRQNIRCDIIPDAFDQEVFFPRDKEIARSVLHIGRHNFVVLYFGLTFAYHGLENLLYAFALFRASGSSGTLLLVGGKDKERDEIRNLVDDLKMGDDVCIVGPQTIPETANYIAASDLVVIPGTYTKSSASPLKLFECAACARPIVSIDLPALREILPPATVYYVPLDDIPALSHALQWMKGHSVEAEKMAAQAQGIISQYTYNARASRIISMCTDLSVE